MVLFRYKILLLILLLIAHLAKAQQKNLSFVHIGVEQGLSHTFVKGIYQDSRGFMWIATGGDGVNKYDGYKFTIYRNDPDNKYSLSNNHVNQILEDFKGNIWMATENGLARFDRNTEKFITYNHNAKDKNSLSDKSVSAILMDSEGVLWVGTQIRRDYQGGLNSFDEKTGIFSHYLIGSDVKTIIEDHNKNLWMGSSNNGVFFYNRKEKRFINYRHDQNTPTSLSGNNVQVIFQDSQHNVWVGTREGGLNKFDEKNNSFKHYRKGNNLSKELGSDAVLSLAEDQEGILWIGTENGGLSLLNPITEKMFNYTYALGDPSGVSSNSFHAMFRDAKGNMWLGAFGSGVDMLNNDGNKFAFYKQSVHGKGLNHYGIFTITEDSEGNILVGTDGGGINIMDKKTGEFTYMMNIPENKNSICGNHILSLREDSDKNIWVGTWADGVTMYNRQKNIYKHFKNIPNDSTSLSGDNAKVIFEDSDKNIWIGTYWGGLSLYDKKNEIFKQFKKDYKNPEGIGSDVITCIFEDKKGNIWIGTYNGGLEKYNKKTQTFTHFIHSENKNSISSDIVSSIHEDINGMLWIGTISGLNYFNPETNQFSVYSTKDGLPHNLIKGITSDDLGNLWISTNGGLSRMDIHDKTFKNFIGKDGIKIIEFSVAVHKSKSGKLYFGGSNGFIEFSSENIKERTFEPPLWITDFLIFNEHVKVADSLHPNSPLKKHISETDSITLSYKESVISFEFAALNYTIERKKQYAYKLVGFDKKWNDIGTKRTATYTNLDPGNYTLQVRTLNNEGKWSNNIRRLYITITPPYWRTWWFMTLSALLFLGSGFAIYWVRISSIKRQKEILEEQVEARTHQLKLANEELVEQKGEISKQRQEIESLYIEIKDSIKAAEEIQEAILPSLDYIKNYLKDFFVFYKPKDIVSGDFYWFQVKSDKIIIAAIDCTGHGVSGALMSINGHYLLKLAISESENLTASDILERLNQGVIKELNQDKHELMSGMDISLCVINMDKKVLQYAGANSPLFLVREGRLMDIKGDKFSIGQNVNRWKVKFQNHVIDLQPNDNIYMFSDGIADQFGGESGDEKFNYSRLRQLLTDISNNISGNPSETLERNLKGWMANAEQLDDIMVIGFKV